MSFFSKNTDSEFYLLFSSLYIKLASWPLEWGLSPDGPSGLPWWSPTPQRALLEKASPLRGMELVDQGFSRAQRMSTAFFQSKELCLRKIGFQPFRDNCFACNDRIEAGDQSPLLSQGPSNSTSFPARMCSVSEFKFKRAETQVQGCSVHN